MSILKLVFASTLIILTWALVVPAFEFPDEQVHLETVDYVLTHGYVPQGNTLDVTGEMFQTQELLGTLRNSQGQNRYTYHPEYRPAYSVTTFGPYEEIIKSLNTPHNRTTYVKSEGARYPIAYYLYGSYWLQAAGSTDIFTRLFAVRLSSLPLALLMAYLTYQIGQLLFSRPVLAASLVALTFLHPMFNFVTAGINSDNLHNLWFFALIYACLSLIKLGPNLPDLLALTLICLGDIWTKPQGYLSLAFAFLALVFALYRARHWRLLGGMLAILSFIFVVTRSIWLGYLFSPNFHGAEFGAFLQFSLNKLVSQNIVWYWGVFKWLGVVMPPLYWQLANRLVLLATLGLAVYGWKVWRRKRVLAHAPLLTFLLILGVGYPLAIYWADWQHHKNVGYSLGIQARYFYPVIVAHLSLFLTGLLSLGWNDKVTLLIRRLVVLFFLTLQLGGLGRIITSYYDFSSLSVLLIQLSQYKPALVKDHWWYVWLTLYLISLIYLLKNALSAHKESVPLRPQKLRRNNAPLPDRSD